MIYMCNCAECGAEIVSRKSFAESDEEAELINKMHYHGKVLAVRLSGRPWCSRCFNAEASGNCQPSRRTGVLKDGAHRRLECSSLDDVPGIYRR